MANTEKRMDVIISAIFMEAEQPANWAQPFEWKPNVSIYFKPIDANRKIIGDEIRARTNGADNLWIFQAMGGKQAKGKCFDIITESGTNPKPWTSFMPLAMLHPNGTMTRISAPEEGVPPPEPPTGPPPRTPVPGSPAPGTPPREPVPAQPTKSQSAANGEKLPPCAAEFMQKVLFVPQSNEWWQVKDRFNIDGAIISNSFQFAAMIAAKQGASNVDEMEENILGWAAWFESMIRETQCLRTRERLTMMMGLATNKEQVTELVNQAWAKLTKSHYDVFKSMAMGRLDMFENGHGDPQPFTPNPEVQKPNGKPSIEEAPVEQEIPF